MTKHIRSLVTSNIAGYWLKTCPMLLGGSELTKYSKVPDRCERMSDDL